MHCSLGVLSALAVGALAVPAPLDARQILGVTVAGGVTVKVGTSPTTTTAATKASTTAQTTVQSAAPSAVASTVPYGVSPQAWATLQSAVGGRLYRGFPMGRPCYVLAANNTGGSANAQQCQADQNGWRSEPYIANQFGGYETANWAGCQATGQNCELDFQTPQNPLAYAPPRVCYQGSVSDYYVDARSASDVQAAFAFAQQTKVAINIKNSGHDYKGRSAAPNSLGVWVHNIQTGPTLVQNFVAAGCSADTASQGKLALTFGAGVAFGQLYDYCNQNNCTVVGGSSMSVVPGGGWISGGGHSSLSNTFGLGVDNVLEMKVVLPNGQFVTASRCQNAELFYALRGSGGGVFGTNIEMTMRVQPKLTLQVAYIKMLSLSPTARQQFLQLCIQQATIWGQHGWGGYIEPGAETTQGSGFVLVSPSINNTQAKADMKPLTDFASSLGNIALNNEVTQVDGFMDYFNNYLEPNAELVGVGIALGSRLIPKTQFATTSGQQQLLTAMINGANTVGSNVLPITSPGLIYGGAPLQILVTAPSSYTPDGTSSVTPLWYSSLWHVIIGPTFNYLADANAINQAWANANKAADYLRAFTPPAAYQNEAHIWEPNYQESFWGMDNYNKLTAMKPQYDPNNILTCHQCIGWNPNDARYKCYPPQSS